MEELDRQFANFYLECIKKRILIPALNSLLFPYLEETNHCQNSPEGIFHAFWERTQLDRTHLVKLSVHWLKKAFLKKYDKLLRLAAQELLESETTALPGVAFHLALAALLAQDSSQKKNASTESALKIILQKALVDVVQDPLFETRYHFYSEHIKKVSESMQALSPDAFQPTEWLFIDAVIRQPNSASTDEVWKAFYLLLMKLNALVHKIKHNGRVSFVDISLLEEYLMSHPQAVNHLVIEGYSKHFEFAKKFTRIPLLWHLAFLDQWKNESQAIPSTLPKTLKWLRSSAERALLTICKESAWGYAYLQQFSYDGLSQLLLNLADNYITFDVMFHRFESTIARLVDILPKDAKTEQAQSKTDQATTIIQFLETIDHERYSFFLGHAQLMLEFADKLLDFYSLQDVFNSNFFEIHRELDKYFDSLSARRVAYLALLWRKLSISGQINFFTTVELVPIIRLMERKFDLESYDSSMEDIVLTLYYIAKAHPSVYLKHLLKEGREKAQYAIEFLSAYVDLFTEALPAADSKVMSYIAKWIYGYFLELQNLVDDINMVANAERKLKESGIIINPHLRTVLTFVRLPDISCLNDTLTVPVKTSSLLSDRMGLTQAKSRPNQNWADRMIEKLTRLKKIQQEAYIPVVYHPYYGYAFFYREPYDNIRSSIAATHYCLISYDKAIPKEIYLKIKSRSLQGFLLKIVFSKQEQDESKSFLKGTSLEDAKIWLIHTKVLPDKPAEGISTLKVAISNLNPQISHQEGENYLMI